MRVTLDLVLDCPPDAAWEAVHSPAVFRAVSGPWTAVESLEPGGFPERWPGGDHRVRLRMLGALPMGTQLIRLSDEITPTERVVHDTGGPQSGAMRVVRSWHHRMGVSALAGHAHRTRFRDELTRDPENYLTGVTFDAFGRATVTTRYARATQSPVSTAVQPSVETDPGDATSYTYYDRLDRVTSAQDAEGYFTEFATAAETYSEGMTAWNEKEDELLARVTKSKEALKAKLQDDWQHAAARSTSIQETTKSVQAETVRVVEEQMEDLHEQMTSLDDFVTRARSQNAEHNERHGGECMR